MAEENKIEQIREEEERHGVLPILFSLTSFIPLIGVLIGVICVVIGIVSKKKYSNVIGIIGFLGIMFTFLLYGSMFYMMMNNEEVAEKLAEGMEMHSENNLTTLVRHIEYFNLQNGKYPESIDEIRGMLKEGEIVVTYDMKYNSPLDTEVREFYLEVINDGRNYLLFGLGKDNVPFTEDDIYPIIDIEKDKNIGWKKNK